MYQSKVRKAYLHAYNSFYGSWNSIRFLLGSIFPPFNNTRKIPNNTYHIITLYNILVPFLNYVVHLVHQHNVQIFRINSLINKFLASSDLSQSNQKESTCNKDNKTVSI